MGSGIYIRLESGEIHDVCSITLPREALDAWLDQLNVDQLRTTVRMLIERTHEEFDAANGIGFDACYPPEE